MIVAAEALHEDGYAVDHQNMDSGKGWRAELELEFKRRGERTVLAHRRHLGPMLVQSAFYPEGNPCHVYLLHPPGGLVGGDQLHVDVKLAERAHALLTTPAAGKFYRSRMPGNDGPVGTLTQDFEVRKGAMLEWLPCESIVFDGANCDARTRIHMHKKSKLLAWEGWVFGRPACNETFDSGTFSQQLEIQIDGCPVLVERNRMLAGSPWMHQHWGLGSRVAMASLIAYPGGESALHLARSACLNGQHCLSACTDLDGVLVCRVLASALPALRAQMERWWQVLRPLVIGCDPIPPRIWAT